jgi:diguanylate cyclase (GGDEF)-like protein
MLARDESRDILPVREIDSGLDGSITGGLRQTRISDNLSAAHPEFRVSGHDVVGSRETIGTILINGEPLWVIDYASAATISDAATRVLIMAMAFVAFLIVGIGGLILYLNGRVVRGERETARSIQIKNLELTDANKQLERMATTDPLTDLPNRTLLNDRLEQSLLAADRQKSTLGLLLLDLDRFKEINDTLGHAYGDIMLQQVSWRLRHALRASDTVARLGGDEFAVLVPAVTVAGAQAIAAKILEELAAPFQIEDLALDVGASIGIAIYPEHGGDAATLLRLADVAMYVAKREHAGSAVYSPAEDQHSPHRLVLMSDLRQAISQSALLLYYQPKVDVSSGRINGVEALLRWPKRDNGFIPPDQFIQLAEYTGLIGPLTQWVLETAVRQCRLWQDAGLSLSVAVNLSMRTLHDHQLPADVTRMLHRYGVAPDRLTLEITESALMADMGRALDVIARLGASGVRVAIDDFGTGYSSLGYLKRLPVHEIKLDKSFVLGLGTHADRRDEAIVRSVIEMAHALERTVVAEGVEHRAAWDKLSRFGCDVAQGYYMSRPLPAAELVRWLAASPWGKLATVG